MTPGFNLILIIDAPIIAIILGIGVLLFGADKIPKLARSMGQAKKEFESASRGEQQPDESRTAVPSGPQTPGATPPAPPPPTQQ